MPRAPTRRRTGDRGLGEGSSGRRGAAREARRAREWRALRRRARPRALLPGGATRCKRPRPARKIDGRRAYGGRAPQARARGGGAARCGAARQSEGAVRIVTGRGLGRPKLCINRPCRRHSDTRALPLADSETWCVLTDVLSKAPASVTRERGPLRAPRLLALRCARGWWWAPPRVHSPAAVSGGHAMGYAHGVVPLEWPRRGKRGTLAARRSQRAWVMVAAAARNCGTAQPWLCGSAVGPSPRVVRIAHCCRKT